MEVEGHMLTGLFVLAAVIAEPPVPHAVAFERYVAAQAGHVEEPGSTTIEMDASLPKLGKSGRLRAILHRVPNGKPAFDVLNIEGDSTVKHEVIARYLTAQVEAAEIPASSVAITPENYRFRYAGSIATAGKLVYVFEIAPKKKRPGLIAGHLWIDGTTGLAVHQDGYLVKSPSVFIRRVEISRTIENRGGVPYPRTTHLDIDTRLVGHAVLTIEERSGGRERVEKTEVGGEQ
jgi:hypothetical protein